MSEEKPDIEALRRRIPDLPQAITSFGAAVLDDSIYIYGGHHGEAHHYSQSGQSGELLRLDLNDLAAWRVVASGPRLQGLAMVAHGGKLYRVGGFTARNQDDEDQDLWSVSDLACYDPQGGDWESLPPMPADRSSFDAAVAGDTLYVVGGWAMQGEKETVWLDSAHAVDLSQTPLTWKPLAKPPFQRRALSVGALQGKVYVIGGMQPDGAVTTGTVVYDPKADAWTDGPRLPGDDMEGFGTACFPARDRLYVSTASGNILRLSDDGDAWESVAKLKAGRFFHRMLPFDRQHFAILGGASMKTGRFAQVDLAPIDP